MQRNEGLYAYYLILCIPPFLLVYTVVLPLGLNKLPLFGTKIVTLFGRWEKCFFVRKKHSGVQIF